MLVRFDSKVGAFSMFEKDARTMIKLMGHSDTIPGAILGADVEKTLQTFQTSLNEVAKQETQDRSTKSDDEEAEESVSVNRRAYPMLELLKKAAKHTETVMWDFDEKLV
ncbi:protein of unknown function [Thiothrix eikelboomii]|uniref:DUF1840 domain-containing protein n=1 Tax=Thiothrix eikelboomii TaxID=92487 RepID=A0A1T4XGK3_9GAMM|nr:DUF1840 domain-containing protein [Thiothrix eikelboomii]SKA88613.1 protein of unknown function [Thiothrix eikelboomii]